MAKTQFKEGQIVYALNDDKQYTVMSVGRSYVYLTLHPEYGERYKHLWLKVAMKKFEENYFFTLSDKDDYKTKQSKTATIKKFVAANQYGGGLKDAVDKLTDKEFEELFRLCEKMLA